MRFFTIFFLLSITGFHALSQRAKDLKANDFVLSDCGFQPDSSSGALRKQLIADMYARKNNGTLRADNGKLKIPVVVHVIEPEKDKSLLSDDAVREGIQNLNRAFAATGDFGSSLDIGIEFELAHYDPNCNPTTGITRYDASKLDWYVENGLPYLGIRAVENWDKWDGTAYYNIWLVSRFDVVAGVASPDLGSVIKANIFFAGTVAAHETGHYLGLGHVFPAPERGCICGDGDGLNDTPPMMPTGLNATCDFVSGCGDEALATINPCTGQPLGEIQKNFMNYACHEKFTPDQRNLMRAVVETFHAALLSSPALSESKPAPFARLSGPTIIYTTGNASYGYTAIRASCFCGNTVSKVVIDGKVSEGYELNTLPALQFGASKLRSYELTCSNGATDSKTVRFIRIGVQNIQRSCTSEASYSVTFDNPQNFKVSTSAGKIVGNSITGIPNAFPVWLRVEAAVGLRDSVLLDPPCCTTGAISNARCIPTSTTIPDENLGIANFTFGNSINKTTSSPVADGSYYLDFACSEQATVAAGSSYDISVGGTSIYKQYVKVFIDFDGNGEFNGINELVLNGETSGGEANNFTGRVTIPVKIGIQKKLRLRVLADASPRSDACTIYGVSEAGSTVTGSGQIEDYSIYVNAASGNTKPDISELVNTPFHHKTNWPNGRPFVVPNPVVINDFKLHLPDPGAYHMKLVTQTGSPVPILVEKAGSDDQIRISGKNKLAPGLYILKIKHKITGMETDLKVTIL